MPTSHTSKNMDASVPLNIRIKPATRNLIDRAATCRNTPISTAKAMLSTIEAWLRVTTVFVSTPTKFRRQARPHGIIQVIKNQKK